MPTPPENTRRRLAGSTAAITAVRLLPSLAFFAGMVLCSRYLPKDVNGLYQKFWTAFSLQSAIVCLGIPTFILTIPGENVTALVARSKLMRTGLVLSTVLSVVAMAVYEWRSFDHTIVPAIIILVALAFGSIGESLLLKQGEAKRLLTINALYTGGYIIGHVLLIIRYLDFQLLFLFIAIIAVAKLAASYAIIVRNIRSTQAVSSVPNKLDTDRGLKRLWMNLAVSDIISFVFRWIDKAILAVVIAPAAFAVYFYGTQEVPFLPVVMGAVGSSIILHLTGKEDREPLAGLELVKRSAGIMAWVIFPIFFFLAFFRNEVFTVIFSAKYAGAAPLFLISIFVIPIRVYSWSTLFQYVGKMGIVNQGAVLDLVLALVLMYPCYHWWGLVGVAFAFTVTSYVQGGFYVYHLCRILRVGPPTLFPLRQWGLATGVFLVGYCLLYLLVSHYCGPTLSLCIGFIVTGIVIVLPVARIFLRRT